MPTISLQEKFFYSEFNYEKQEEMLNYVKSCIKDDEETMKEINEQALETVQEYLEVPFNAENPEHKKKLDFEIDSLVEEKAEEGLRKVRIYADYDIEY